MTLALLGLLLLSSEDLGLGTGAPGVYIAIPVGTRCLSRPMCRASGLGSVLDQCQQRGSPSSASRAYFPETQDEAVCYIQEGQWLHRSCQP